MALWRIRARLDDRPGYLAVLTASLALKMVNILTVQVHATGDGAVDEFLVEAPDAMTAPELIAAVVKGRGQDPWVRPADARGLVDPTTQALGLAAQVAAEPDRLSEALSRLLGAARVTTSSAADGMPGHRGSTMVLAGLGGEWLRIERDEPPFTPAEYTRAQALVRVGEAAVKAGSDSPCPAP